MQTGFGFVQPAIDPWWSLWHLNPTEFKLAPFRPVIYLLLPLLPPISFLCNLFVLFPFQLSMAAMLNNEYCIIFCALSNKFFSLSNKGSKASTQKDFVHVYTTFMQSAKID